MNKTKLQKLILDIYKINKRFFSVKSAFIKELEHFLDAIPDNNADFLPDELNILQSILKRYAALPENSLSYQLRNTVILELSINFNVQQMASYSIASIMPLLAIKTPDIVVKNPMADLQALPPIADSQQKHLFQPAKDLMRYSNYISRFNPKFYQPEHAAKKAPDFSSPAITFSREEDSLSKEIRKLTTDLPWSSEGMVYLGTNETNTASVAEILTSTPLQAGGCHIGFSSWHNFDMMVMRKSGRGIICDINPRNALFLEAMLGLIRTADNRHDFVNKAIGYLNTSDEVLKFSPNVNDSETLYREIETLAGEVKAELARPSSWLYTDNHFHYIQQLASADKIALITQDIRLTEKFSHLCNLLRENHIPIDSVYISNIYGWMHKEEDQQRLLKTLTLFTAADETVLIYATLVDKNLIQSAIPCGDLSKNKLDEQLALVVDSSSQASSAPK